MARPSKPDDIAGVPFIDALVKERDWQSTHIGTEKDDSNTVHKWEWLIDRYGDRVCQAFFDIPRDDTLSEVSPQELLGIKHAAVQLAAICSSLAETCDRRLANASHVDRDERIDGFNVSAYVDHVIFMVSSGQYIGTPERYLEMCLPTLPSEAVQHAVTHELKRRLSGE